MLTQHLEQCFFDLSCVDSNTLFFHLFHLLLVQLHELDVGIPLNWLHLVVNYLVVAVDAIDVLEETFEDGERCGYRSVNKKSTAEISSRLTQIIRAEVVLCKLTNIVAAKRGLNCVDGGVLSEFIEKCHTRSGLF